MFVNRLLTEELTNALAHSPAVALLGPRQVGKTTLALAIGEPLGAKYLDMESELDRAKAGDTGTVFRRPCRHTAHH